MWILETNIEFVLRNNMYDACVGVEAKKENYVVHPGIDFTRLRKMSMAKIILATSIQENNSLPKELFDIQSNAGIPLENRISVSGYVQQRDKIKPAGFKKAFDNLTKQPSSTIRRQSRTDISLPLTVQLSILPNSQAQRDGWRTAKTKASTSSM